MSKSKNKIVEQLEAKIKQFEEKEPCSAFWYSLQIFEAKKWLPNRWPEDCRALVAEQAEAFNKCISPIDSKTFQERIHKLIVCKEAYFFQMGAARCKVKEGHHSLKFSYQPNSIPGTIAASLAEGSRVIDTNSFFLRYLQTHGYRKDPKTEMKEMSEALERSDRLFKRCSVSPKRYSSLLEPLKHSRPN